jgi:hypothetical protein
MRNERQQRTQATYFRVDCGVICDALEAKFFDEFFGVVSYPQPNTIHENFVDIGIANSGWIIDVRKEIDEAQRPGETENAFNRSGGVHVN